MHARARALAFSRPEIGKGTGRKGSERDLFYGATKLQNACGHVNEHIETKPEMGTCVNICAHW